MDEEILKYSVGPLLYSPALNEGLADFIISGRLYKGCSIAICLEDTVADEWVMAAEDAVCETFKKLKAAGIELPMIFIRVREKEQIERIYDKLGCCSELLTGFVIPKYSPANARGYNEAVLSVNRHGRKLYMMPILESGDIVSPVGRSRILGEIRAFADEMKDYILNIRIGGNDLTNYFGVRRHCDETIYDILPIGGILSDIISAFADSYVVSGAVWEYFSGEDDEWKRGLERELRYDLLNGFVGKTVIHPNQVKVVLEGMKVRRDDYEDAKKILEWDREGYLVAKSADNRRMNEAKTHYHWAKRIMIMAGIYGVREN